MKSDVLGKLETVDREIEVVNYLRARRLSKNDPASATVAEIWESVKESTGDTVSRPAYYKILDGMVAAGKLEKVDLGGVTRYAITDALHSTNRLTLDDVYEMLPFHKSSETMARAIEAQQYFFENRDRVLKAAALALSKENAVNLLFRWIDHQVQVLRKDLETFNMIENKGPEAGKAVLADASLERRIVAECRALRDLAYRYLSIPRDTLDLPDWEGPRGLKIAKQFSYNSAKLRQALETRVFGVGDQQTVLGFVEVEKDALTAAQRELIVSGSDGSFHAGTLEIGTTRRFIEDESYIVTFNNSVAYIRSSELMKQQRGDKKFVHSAPLTRQTLDDPAYKGMVLARFMFQDLTDSEYEHMVRTASDVVQMRVDDEIVNGKARDVATGEQIVTPRVHIRDGTITPQSRGYNQYCAMNPYGDIAREGIQRSRSILQRILASRRSSRIYAGAVKSTQIKLFSRLISWYIAYGSKQSNGGQAIEPNWDISSANFISDVDTMTLLMATLRVPDRKTGFWTSCVVVRQFASLTEFFDTRPGDDGWFGVLNKRRLSQLDNFDAFPGHANLTYDAQLSEEDLEDDSYLYMLERADYASFYVGHTGGEPPPKIPRYEFICSLRDDSAHGGDSETARQHVQRTVKEFVTALKVCKFSQDRDHNFLSKLSLVKLVVSVVYRAHELAKHIGKKFEGEYKSSVVARLAAHKRQPIDPKSVSVQPIGVRKYVQRFANAQEQLPPGETDDEDR